MKEENIETEQDSKTFKDYLLASKFMSNITLREWIKLVKYGFTQPENSGAYRFSKKEIIRLWSPVAGIVLPLLLVLILGVMTNSDSSTIRQVTITVMEPQPIDDKLDPIDPIDQEVKPVDFESPTPPEIEPVMTDNPLSGGSGFAGPSSDGPIGDNVPFSVQVASYNSVAETKSPIKFMGVYSDRNPGSIGAAVSKYGSGGNGNGGGGTEIAVMRALRWLKKNQDTDGKWTGASGGGPGYGPSTPAMTGLALLTFLAHGEIPSSPEFGGTVQRGLEWLVTNQTSDGKFKDSDGNGYSLPIACYALCEAYTMTKIPMIKEAAEKSLKLIVSGQTSKGLWDYNCNKTERNDLSYGGWCVQAVKAGLMANLEVDGLKDCAKEAISGLRAHHGPGGFDYSGPGRSKVLSGTGALCMQLLGASKDSAVEDTIKGEMNIATCDWSKAGNNPFYTWYYTTQAKFHASDDIFKEWNKQFSPTLVKNQTVVSNAIADVNGKMVDIGYWETPKGATEHCTAYVYNTTLCAMMLEVYYRHLPSFKPPEEIEKDVSFSDKEGDIKVKIN